MLPRCAFRLLCRTQLRGNASRARLPVGFAAREPIPGRGPKTGEIPVASRPWPSAIWDATDTAARRSWLTSPYCSEEGNPREMAYISTASALAFCHAISCLYEQGIAPKPTPLLCQLRKRNSKLETRNFHLRSRFCLLHFLNQRGDDLEQVADGGVVGDFEDGGFGILVDGHDGARAFHAHDVLNGAADTESQIELRRDGLPG